MTRGSSLCARWAVALLFVAWTFGAVTGGGAADTALRLPADIVLQDQPDSPGVVVFSHGTHASFTDNRCVSCHPQPFSILGNHRAISHEEMNVGGTCGKCHNGSDATGVEDADSCDVCHSGARGRDVMLPSNPDSPGRVVFRHATHDQACPTCHEELFAMRAAATPLDKGEMLEGGSCGHCHDGKAAFGADDMDHCETCHAGGGS